MPFEAFSCRVLHQRGEGLRAVPQGHGLEERVPQRPEAIEPPGAVDQVIDMRLAYKVPF